MDPYLDVMAVRFPNPPGQNHGPHPPTTTCTVGDTRASAVFRPLQADGPRPAWAVERRGPTREAGGCQRKSVAKRATHPANGVVGSS